MNANPNQAAQRYVNNLKRSGKSIYSKIEIGDPDLWIPTPELEALLDAGLRGMSLAGLPLRTRSKVVKQAVCRALGYPVPGSFQKTQPRFFGQQFDTYVQKSNNLQVWNEELAPTRRYVLIRVSGNDEITKVKAVTGDKLAELDTTGTLTQKYQARCLPGSNSAELIADTDTALLRPLTSKNASLARVSPAAFPEAQQLLPIRDVYARLSSLIGIKLQDAGFDQDRNRGAALHRFVCEVLGYDRYEDTGQFPDLRHQLIEVKLQTSPTIDLGLVLPTSTEPLDVPMMGRVQVHHCDVRYVILYGVTNGQEVQLTHLFVTTGEAFFERFPQFQGKVLNRKLQIPLPADFFEC